MRQILSMAFTCLLLSATAPSAADWPQAWFDAGHTAHNPGETGLSTSNVGRLRLAWSQHSTGFWAGAIVADGRIYVGGSDDRLHAYDAETGVELWSGPSEGVLFANAGAFSDGLVFASATSEPLRAYDAETGVVVWSAPENSIFRASPTVDSGVVYATSFDGILSAFDAASGAHLWSTAEACCVFDQAPAVDGGRVFQMRTNGTLTAYHASTGTELWTIVAFSAGSVTAANGRVLFGNTPDVVAVDQATGEELWRTPVFDTATNGSPAVADGRVFVQTASLVALDEETGAVLWSVPVAGSAGVSVANGVVYAAEGNGVFGAYGAADGTRLGSVSQPGCSGTCSTSIPVPVDGTLLLASPDSGLRAYRPGPDLTVTGECPGVVTLHITDATPNGSVLLAAAAAGGSSTLPGGSCAGTELALENPKIRGRLQADGLGRVELTIQLGSSRCSTLFQGVDLRTCLPTDAAGLP